LLLSIAVDFISSLIKRHTRELLNAQSERRSSEKAVSSVENIFASTSALADDKCILNDPRRLSRSHALLV